MSNSKQWLEELRGKRKESQEREHDEFMYQTEVLGHKDCRYQQRTLQEIFNERF